MADEWANFAIAPAPLSREGDLVKNWYRWKESFSIFIKGAGYATFSSDEKAAILRNKIGLVGLEALDNIQFDNELDQNNIDIVLEKLSLYFDPPLKEVVQRYNFFTKMKQSNETLEAYIKDLKEKAKTCNFGRLTNSLIRDKVVAEIKDKALCKKFFDEDNLDLDKLIKIFKAHQIEKTKNNAQSHPNNGNVQHERMQQKSAPSNQVPPHVVKRPCWRCSTFHAVKKCPARGSKCDNCNELHHYTRCCKNANKQNDLKKTNRDKVVNKVLNSNTMNPQPGCSNVQNLQPSAPDPSLLDNNPLLYPNLYALKTEHNMQNRGDWRAMNLYNIQPQQPQYKQYNNKL